MQQLAEFTDPPERKRKTLFQTLDTEFGMQTG
jgi:hypothetical protein